MKKNYLEIKKNGSFLSEEDLSRVIEMAWEDRTPFEAIEYQFGLNEQAVIGLMRNQLRRRSFKSWRSRVSGKATKHKSKRPDSVLRGNCQTQYKIKSQ